MLTVGLTGGIASGKSTVAERFQAQGCHVLYADRVAHDLMAPGQPAYDEVVREFGSDVVAPDGTLDRQRLGAVVFADPARLARLNQIVHPRVVARLEEEMARLAQQDPGGIVVVEAALLIEADYARRFDRVIVVWCTPEQQRERLMKKTGLSEAEAHTRLAVQMSPEQKRDRADYIIDTSGTREESAAQVDKLLAELRRQATSR